MILLDANILLYAYDEKSVYNGRLRPWLDAILSGNETIGLPWVSAWAFVRISTNPRLSQAPFATEEAFAVIGELRESPLVVMINPGRRHQEILLVQMLASQVRGPETTNAVIASLAIENGATLASTDLGFRRFPDLNWINPLD